jgi:hypothetical protein
MVLQVILLTCFGLHGVLGFCLSLAQPAPLSQGCNPGACGSVSHKWTMACVEQFGCECGSGQLIPRCVSFLLLSVVSTQWVWGGWTGCSASCDQGTQTNTAICSGGLCNPADQPATLSQNWYLQTSNRMTNCDDSG